MSATGRGAERREADHYPTPAWVTERLLDHVFLPAGRWLEPSAGEGHIIRAVSAKRPDVVWHAVELRPVCKGLIEAAGAQVKIADFLEQPLYGRRFDVAFGNPPFGLATEFVLHALTMADQVVFLLRLSLLESRIREGFFKRVGVPDVFVLPERPSFKGDGGTDSCAYAWMRWKADRSQEGRISILYDKRQPNLLGGV